MAKSKIVTIEIELKDYEPIKFTMDEAKELYEQLDSLFGEKTVERHHYHDWWRRPYISWTTQGGVPVYTNASQVSVSAGNAVSNLANTTVSSSSTGMQVKYLTN